MSAVSLTIFTVVAFSLLGAAVAWLAHEDAARARLTHQRTLHGRRRAFLMLEGYCRVLLFSTGRKTHRMLQRDR